MNVQGILLLHYLPTADTAATTVEHVDAFSQHSQFAVYPVNTACGFPSELRSLHFEIVVLHYSLFGPPRLFGAWPDGLSSEFKQYLLEHPASLKIAFFQDEYRYCRERFDFLDRFGVALVYTLLDPKYWGDVYERHTSVRKFVHTLTGYVDSRVVARARSLVKPDGDRTVDVGYRARRLDFYMGKGAQEKTFIAEEFVRRDDTHGLTLDISVGEPSRIHGDAWLRFLANCRGVLGVEAGTSVFDVDGSVQAATSQLLRRRPDASFQNVFDEVLKDVDGRIQYRTISPRHFEAATLKVCQILFEGEYQGILEPGVHYLALKKEFSNLADVVAAFRDAGTRTRLTEAAYRDVIASGRWSYERFVAEFDDRLRAEGYQPASDGDEERRAVVRRLDKGRLVRAVRGRLSAVRSFRFPGREQIASRARRFLNR